MKSSVVSGENRGSVNEILLKALQSGDKYGYEINKEIETKSGGKFFLKEASLYSGLKRLQASGYISSYWQDGELGIKRHYYSITQKGLEKLASSNFTWDSSKNFLDEMFKNDKAQNILNLNQNVSQQNMNDNELKENIILQNKDNSLENNENKEIKKNPFQIEVSPLQQSFFDLNQNSDEKQNQETQEIKIKTDENAENIEIDKTFENENNTSLVLGENKQGEKTKNQNLSNEYSYEKLINNYENDNYSTSIQKDNVIDIAKLFSNDKINDSSIVFDKNNNENVEKFNEKKFIEPAKIEENIENVKFENNENQKLNLESVSEENDKVQDNQNQELNVDFKNIFGSLLVSDKNENICENNDVINTTENEEKFDDDNNETEEKPELPRINVDDNVNVMLKPTKSTSNYDYTANNYPTRSYEDKLVQNTSSGSGIKGVKQYINNVHKQTLISRATNITEEVNLEGINIREYSKMNNKLIKNSNYIYSGKLNFVLALLFSLIIITESIISFIVLNKNGLLGTFEIILFSLTILSGLILTYVYSYKYIKDKYKVELKNYNFKSICFYFCLIFVVLLVLVLCLNIFAGMNANNSSDFITKIVLEGLILINFVLFPFVKLLFYKSKFFTS